MTAEFADMALWLLWLASWLGAAFWADSAAMRPAVGEQLGYRAVTIAGALLVFAGSQRFRYGAHKLWIPGEGIDWGLVAIVALGLLFTWWARLYLGRLWSSSVTKKADHRVVDSGPYAIVRHPIYTGLIAAVFATAGLLGAPIGIVGAVLMTFGFWIKATLEERFLREQLGADAYDSYRRRVPMLLPFGSK
jgi:protein-S-isoprenylcysteine O-methyltransferase Ste14